jgi:hypothetical protein
MISPLATAFLLLPTLGMSQWPDPEPGTVPIRDPSIVKSTNGTYYLFGTNDLLYTSTCMNGPWVAQDGPLGNPNAIVCIIFFNGLLANRASRRLRMFTTLTTPITCIGTKQ